MAAAVAAACRCCCCCCCCWVEGPASDTGGPTLDRDGGERSSLAPSRLATSGMVTSSSSAGRPEREEPSTAAEPASASRCAQWWSSANERRRRAVMLNETCQRGRSPAWRSCGERRRNRRAEKAFLFRSESGFSVRSAARACLRSVRELLAEGPGSPPSSRSGRARGRPRPTPPRRHVFHRQAGARAHDWRGRGRRP